MDSIGGTPMIVKLILTGALGTLGFAILFNIKPKHVPFAVLGGAIATLIYALLDAMGVDLFLSNFVATLACGAYSTAMARILKTPSMVFVTASIIPLVPGGSLFYTMSNLILGNTELAGEFGLKTLQVALGIAGGIVIESLIGSFISKKLQSKIRTDTE